MSLSPDKRSNTPQMRSATMGAIKALLGEDITGGAVYEKGLDFFDSKIRKNGKYWPDYIDYRDNGLKWAPDGNFEGTYGPDKLDDHVGLISDDYKYIGLSSYGGNTFLIDNPDYVKPQAKPKAKTKSNAKNMNRSYLMLVFTFLITSCGHTEKKIKETSLSNGVTSVNVPYQERLDSTKKIYNVDTLHFGDFLNKKYHFDSTFGTSIRTVTTTKERNDNKGQHSTAVFVFKDHTIEVNTHFFKNEDSVTTNFYLDKTEFKIIKDEDGTLLHSGFDLDYGEDPLIWQYVIESKGYFYLEGTAKGASGKFADVLYGVVFDISNRQVFLLQTYIYPGTFLFKKVNNKLGFLVSQPIDNEEGGFDSVHVEIKELN